MNDDEKRIDAFLKEVSALAKVKGIIVGWSQPKTLESKITYPESPDEVDIVRQSRARVEVSTKSERYTEQIKPETWTET